jgi:hypothetical protein
MDAKYFEKFIKDLISEDVDNSENELLNESSDKKVKKQILIEENYARKLIKRYSEDHLNSVRYKK